MFFSVFSKWYDEWYSNCPEKKLVRVPKLHSKQLYREWLLNKTFNTKTGKRSYRCLTGNKVFSIDIWIILPDWTYGNTISDYSHRLFLIHPPLISHGRFYSYFLRCSSGILYLYSSIWQMFSSKVTYVPKYTFYNFPGNQTQDLDVISVMLQFKAIDTSYHI